jgi:hypothetical protein
LIRDGAPLVDLLAACAVSFSEHFSKKKLKLGSLKVV